MWKSSLTQGAASLVIGAGLGIAAPQALAATSTNSMSHSSRQITESYAKSRILGDNYTNVTNLKQTGDGWTANAMESGKQVSLTVNDMGDVDKT